ncbi:hypothetical protein HALLA_18275 [Halostagnicola larsenii XH-48]|uniref:Uncharacterized protein n=1 Tax=Halostagnicola larsenii XH-48 TaxID=797299 RepID=W0JRB2_9EURY|nr:hypothetical protein [Halostagnicola larsenii]AHG01154.1 hypothetical protein HALLA_18275 [Halostagnicola larsenii XH-48]
MTDDEREIEIDVETNDDRSADESPDDGISSEGEFETAPWSTDPNPLEDRDGVQPRDLEDELGRIDVMSTPEGYVEGRVTDLETVDETTVRLEVALPHGRTTSFALEKPIPWSDEFLLARIVEDVGYDAASVGHLVGESVFVTRADLENDADEWDGLRATAARAAGRTVNSLLEASLGGRFERTETGPTWRLVDPLERPDPIEDDGFDALSVSIALGLVLAGVLAAVAGAVFGATGGIAVSSAMIAYALPGVILALVGVLVAYSLDGNGE